jgi:hypothetical protein
MTERVQSNVWANAKTARPSPSGIFWSVITKNDNAIV